MVQAPMSARDGNHADRRALPAALWRLRGVASILGQVALLTRSSDGAGSELVFFAFAIMLVAVVHSSDQGNYRLFIVRWHGPLSILRTACSNW